MVKLYLCQKNKKNRKLNVHYRFFPQLHRDSFFTNRSKRLRVHPWNELILRYRFLADVKEGGRYIGTIVEPVLPKYDDIYHGAFIEYTGKGFGDGDIFTRGETTSDLPLEYHMNDGETGKDRLLALLFNVYDETRERVEHRATQIRRSMSKHPVFLPINFLKYIINNIKKREKIVLAELGELFDIDFGVEPSMPMKLDEDVFPYQLWTLGAKRYRIKDTEENTIVDIRRNPGKRYVSAGKWEDYTVKIDERYADNEELVVFSLCLTHYIHSRKNIRKKCFYEGLKPEEIPDPGKVLITD